MDELSQAELYLIDQVRRKDAAAWSQLVQRYQGRLCAFARTRAKSPADAEDLVQETFLSFLKSLPAFRGQASLETYLFTILRRRLADTRRSPHLPATPGDDPHDLLQALPASDPTASAYAARHEARSDAYDALRGAVSSLSHRLQQDKDLRELRLLDLLFCAHLRNKEIAAELSMTEQQVALFKHRCLKQLQEDVHRRLQSRSVPSSDTLPDSLLTRVWHDQRPTCPKRSTIGRYTLGALDPAWHAYVHAHLHRIACPFCLANLHDLQGQFASAPTLPQRIFESTIGFFKPAP